MTGTPDPAAPTAPSGATAGRAMLLRGTSWQAASQFIPIVINIVLTPYVIHGLGLQLYGIFLLLNSIQFVLSTFNGGIGPSVSRYLAVYAGRGDKESATRLVTTMTVIVAALVVVIFGGFLALIPKLFEWFPVLAVDRDGAVFLITTQVLLAGMLQIRSIFQSVLAAAGRFALTSWAIILGHIIYTVGMIITVETGAGLVGIAWLFVAQQTLSTVMMIPAALRHLTRSGVGFVGRDFMGEFFAYAWKVQLASWVDITAQQIDTIIVGRFRPEQLGYFGPGVTFAQQLRMVLMNAVGPMITFVGRAVGERSAEGARDPVEKLQRYWVRAVTGYFAVGIPAAYFGVNAWLNLGSTIPGAVAALLLVGHAAAMLVRVLIVWCQMMRQPGLEVAQGLVFLVAKIVGTVALVIPLGVIGVAAATSLSSLIAALYLCWIANRRLSVRIALPWREIPWLLAIGAGGLAWACTYGAHLLIGFVVPFGVLGLLTCAAAAAPALVLYLEFSVGLRNLVAMVKGR